MQDDLTIPSPTYRVPRHSHGMDPATRQLAMIAAAIGFGLVAVIGGWHMVTNHRQGVPVVEAEPGPLRVKPANPGGLQVAGVGNDIFSGGSDTDVQKLAPAPQTPDPQALQAMVVPKPVAAAAPAVVASAAPAAQPHAAVVIRASQQQPAAASGAGLVERHDVGAIPGVPAAAPRADMQTAAARAQAASLPAPAVADHTAAAGSVMVQLAALSSEQAVRLEWRRLAARWPDLLGHRQPVVSKTVHDGHVFWRLRTGGFEDLSAATTFCVRLRADGGACSVADF